MEKNIKIGLVVSIIGIIFIGGWLISNKAKITILPSKIIQPISNCSTWEQQIKEKVEKANYCSVDSDCIGIKLNDGCLGCFIVNKNEGNDIREEAGEFRDKCNKVCLIDCIHEGAVGLKCINGKCPWPVK